MFPALRHTEGWPAAAIAASERSRSSRLRSSTIEYGDGMYSNSEKVLGLRKTTFSAPSSTGCRLSRIFWKRPRLTCPGRISCGRSWSVTKLPTRNAWEMTSLSWLEYVGSTTEKLGSA